MAMTKAKLKPSSNETITATLHPATGVNAATCVVSKGTVIDGTFRSEQDVRLDGMVQGDVRCTKRFVMGDTGKVEGKVIAQDAVIMGVVEGEVIVKGTLHLKPTAVIYGNLTAKSILVDEGARYDGECKVGIQ